MQGVASMVLAGILASCSPPSPTAAPARPAPVATQRASGRHEPFGADGAAGPQRALPGVRRSQVGDPPFRWASRGLQREAALDSHGVPIAGGERGRPSAARGRPGRGDQLLWRLRRRCPRYRRPSRRRARSHQHGVYHTGLFAEAGFGGAATWDGDSTLRSTTLGRVSLGWADRF